MKKIYITIVLLLSVVIAVTASRFTQKRNLKVLPKDIGEKQLDSLMKTYAKALGVKCNFCHVPYEGVPDKLNFASDAEPMKTEARKMMRMTRGLNKKYFRHDKKIDPLFLTSVTCNTCHRGNEFPPED